MVSWWCIFLNFLSLGCFWTPAIPVECWVSFQGYQMPRQAKASVLKKKKKRVSKALPGMDQVMQSRLAKKKYDTNYIGNMCLTWLVNRMEHVLPRCHRSYSPKPTSKALCQRQRCSQVTSQFLRVQAKSRVSYGCNEHCCICCTQSGLLRKHCIVTSDVLWTYVAQGNRKILLTVLGVT